LRDFRERYLLTHSAERAFIGLCHKFTPPIARVIARNGILRPAGRVGRYPVAGFLSIPPHFSHAGNIVLFLVMVAVAGGMILAVAKKK
jgi:hypothetical protein